MTHCDTCDLVDEKAACRILGGEESPMSRSTLWRGIKTGRFPRPLKIGTSINRWKLDELRAVCDRAAANRHATD